MFWTLKAIPTFCFSLIHRNPHTEFISAIVGRCACLWAKPNLATRAIMKVCAGLAGAAGAPFMTFKLKSTYQPRGDQPPAITQLLHGAEAGDKPQGLLGVTGSRQTFAMAKVIEASNRPSLGLSHHTTLAP